jgi:phosphoribosylformylglycinamidine synthase
MVGLLEDVTCAVGSHFRTPGDAILLLGTNRGHLGGSAYWAEVLDTVGGAPPPVDLEAERALHDVLVQGASSRLFHSAHDLSDGGLAVALAESCIGGPWATTTLGALVDLAAHADALSDEEWMFGEDAGRVLLSTAPGNVLAVQELAASHGVPCLQLGLVGESGSDLVVSRGTAEWRWSTPGLRRIHLEAIPRRMQTPVAAGEQ